MIMTLSMFKIGLFLLLLICPQPSFEEQVRTWRMQRDRELRSENGWLTVAGLFWLKEGSNSFGTGKDMDIVLTGSAPPNIGSLELANGVVTLKVADGVKVTDIGGAPIQTYEMRLDSVIFDDGEAQRWLVSSITARNERDDPGVRRARLAALGNVVAQLHVHIIARFRTDPAWPNPVWGKVKRIPHQKDQRDGLINAMRRDLQIGALQD